MAFARAKHLKQIILSSSAAFALMGAAANAADEPVQFRIESGSLADALNEFARQSNREILVSTDIVEGKRARALNGSYEPEEALSILLNGVGLEYSVNGGNTIFVTSTSAAAVQEIESVDNRAAGPIDSNAEPGSVTGGVKDERTGANLKGALIEIAETGQTTSTDDLGNFRFSSIRPGRYTLRISYLGFRDIEAAIEVRPGERFDQSFALIGGDGEDVIMVYGNRSARAQSLNQERTAANSTTVLSADILGNFNGTTISEALRRAPGVAFVPDENTGEGANIILRGLEPDLNQIQLNGLPLLDGSGLGRSPDLSGILTESIESVTINKSLLPSQESNGAGGLVEIETKSPLDRDRRFASFGVEYGKSGGDFGDEIGFSGAVSAIVTENEDLGFSFSASYRETETTRLSYGVDPSGLGPYLPLGEPDPVTGERQPIGGVSLINPLTLFPFEPGVDDVYPVSVTASQGTTQTDRLSLTGGAHKKFGDHTDLRLDVTFTEREDSIYRAGTLVQSMVGGQGIYDFGPVAELDGEIRGLLVAEQPNLSGQNPFTGFFFGSGISGTVRREAEYRPRELDRKLGVTLRGDTVIDDWYFSYRAGYSRSKEIRGGRTLVALSNQTAGSSGFVGLLIERDQLLPEALNNVTADGRVISVFAPLSNSADGRFIAPLFTGDGFEFYNDLDNIGIQPIFAFGTRESEGDAYTAAFDAAKRFDGEIVKYVKAGANYQRTTSFSPSVLEGNGSVRLRAAPGLIAADLGLVSAPGLLTRVGAPGDFDSISQESVISLVSNIDAFVDEGMLVAINEDTRGGVRRVGFADTTETTFAAYVEGQINLGKLELIGGFRLERVDIESTFFTEPFVRDVDGTDLLFGQDFGEIVTDAATQTDFLPRILANYRFSENMLLRAGYYTTVSRPQLNNVTQRQALSLDFDPSSSLAGDRPLLTVTRGNPDLRPTVTHNFNLDWEWYSNDIGVIKIGAFYKILENPLQSNRQIGGVTSLPDDLILPDISFFNDLPDPLEVRVIEPVNDDDNSRLWGAEVTVERQFAFLPGVLGGLGVYANYTYADSESEQRLFVLPSVDPQGFVEFKDVPFTGSPKHQGTLGVTYNKYNIDASLLYSQQARRLSSIGAFGFNNYNEAVQTLDFRAEYFFGVRGADIRAFVRAEDLLSGEEDAFLQTSVGGDNGVPKYFTGGTYFGGRSFFLGLTTTF